MKRNFRCDQNAATMIELAMVISLFLITILFFTDCARFFMTRALLIRGSQEAADLASRIPDFDIDTIKFTQTSAESQRFRDARNIVANAAYTASSVGSVIASSAANSWIHLRSYSAYDQYSNVEATNQPFDVLILRPGESASVVTPAGAPAWVHNPLRCAAAHQTGGCSPRDPNDSMDSMMRTLPIMVQMQASVRTITPFVGPWTAQATTLSWREQPAKSGFRDAQYTTLPQNVPIPTPFNGTQTPLPCETNSEAACVARGRCLNFCDPAACCFCQACDRN